MANLVTAAETGNIKEFERLLDAGGDPNFEVNPYIDQDGEEHENGMSAFIIACLKKQTEIVSILLDKGYDIHGNLQEHEPEIDGVMPFVQPLHIALMTEAAEVAHLLLHKGADPNAMYVRDDGEGSTDKDSCLTLAPNLEILSLLLKNGADPNLGDENGKTAVHHEVWNDKLEHLRALLENGGDPNKLDNDGNTALLQLGFMAASTSIEHLRLLLKNGADPNIGDENGKTAVHHARNNDDIEFLRAVLENGGDPNKLEKTGASTVCRAVSSDSPERLRLLLEKGGDPNKDDEVGDALLFGAAMMGKTEMVRILLEFGADPNKGKDGTMSAIMAAAINGHAEIIRLLVKGGADPDITPQFMNGITPLHIAVILNRVQAVEALLEGNANTDVSDMGGETPLHKAAAAANLNCVSLLCEHGADVSVSDISGHTSYKFAKVGMSPGCMAVLIQHGAVDDGIKIDLNGEFATKVREGLAEQVKSFASMMKEEMEDIAYDFMVEALKTAAPMCCVVS